MPTSRIKNDVVKASGVHTGDNMMRLNRETVKENILSRLIFVDSVSIQKDFPDRLVITIEPSKAAFNVTDSSGTLQVSAAGKILVSGPDSDPSLPTITGFEASVREPGKRWHRGTARRTRSFSPCPNGSPRGWTVR
ncbi:MAG: cell division protein FtsQ/DivIB [Ruminococcus callidus]